MSRRSRVLTFGLPLIGVSSLMAGAALVAENTPSRPAEEPPRPPTTAPIAEAGRGGFIGAVGVSEPPGEPIRLAAHTAGIIERVLVAPGQDVRAGDPLFVVDRRRATQRLAVSRAALSVSRADVDSLRADIPSARAELRAAEAAVRSSRANLLGAQADLADRAGLLQVAEAVGDPRAIASEEVDRRRFARQRAEAGVAVAEATIAEAEAAVLNAAARLARLVDPDTGGDGADIAAALERVARAGREVSAAETDLALLTVTSPVDGRVVQVNVRPGEFAPASAVAEGLVVLGRRGSTHLRVQIDEVDVGRFSKRGRAWASPRGDPATRLDLTLRLVEPLMGPKTGLAGRTSELVDTRVLEVVYELPPTYSAEGIGRQFDVYIESVRTEDAP